MTALNTATAVLVAACVCAAAATQSGVTPVVVTHAALNPGPPAALAYDESRQVGVLFGASNGQTWTWNGNAWFERHPTIAPPARVTTALAWDPNRQCTIMFGGSRELYLNYFQDTWLWDGANWGLVTRSGPSPRMGHGMATDPVRKRVVLFGGEDVSATALSDTWEWDGIRWTQKAPLTNIPFARSGPKMAWNSKTRRVAMFGGLRFPFTTFSFLPCEEWDGQDWTSIPGTAGPQPGYVIGSAVTDPDGRGVLIFGVWQHFGSTPPPPTPIAYLWDGIRLSPQPLGSSPPDELSIPAFLDRAGRSVISPGTLVSNPRDTLTYNLDQPGWNIGTNIPGITAVPDSFEHLPWMDAFLYMINSRICVGTDAGWTSLSSTPRYNGRAIDTVPIVDSTRQEVYAYNIPGTGYGLGILYSWAGGTWNLLPTSQHGLPSQCFPVGFDPIDGNLILQWFGAYLKWNIHGPTLSTVAPVPPGGGLAGTATIDTSRNVISVLYPGTTANFEIREWNGNAWSTIQAPATGTNGILHYMPGVGCILTTTTGIWNWNGQQWSTLAGSWPPDSVPIRMRYDTSRHRMRIQLRPGNYGEDFRDLYVDDFQVSTTEPHPGMIVRFTASSPPHAGQPWLLCLSAATYPGIPLAGLQPEPYRVLPLALDSLLLDSLGSGIRGFLDSQGHGTATLLFPNDPNLVGFRCFAGAISIAGNLQLGLISRPVEINVLR